MRDEQHRRAVAPEFVQPLDALHLEGGVANREDLVDEEDVGLEMCRHGEAKTDVHPRRVPLDRRVDELPDPCELDDLFELPVDLAPLHSKDRSAKENVLAAGQFGMKA